MRTAIFFGSLAIADAIRKDWLSDEYAPFIATMFIVMAIMDVTEFIKKMRS